MATIRPVWTRSNRSYWQQQGMILSHILKLIICPRHVIMTKAHHAGPSNYLTYTYKYPINTWDSDKLIQSNSYLSLHTYTLKHFFSLSDLIVGVAALDQPPAYL